MGIVWTEPRPWIGSPVVHICFFVRAGMGSGLCRVVRKSWHEPRIYNILSSPVEPAKKLEGVCWDLGLFTVSFSPGPGLPVRLGTRSSSIFRRLRIAEEDINVALISSSRASYEIWMAAPGARWAFPNKACSKFNRRSLAKIICERIDFCPRVALIEPPKESSLQDAPPPPPPREAKMYLQGLHPNRNALNTSGATKFKWGLKLDLYLTGMILDIKRELA